MNPLFAANAGLVVTVLVWGTPLPLFDLLLQRWDPILLATLRYLCSLPLLLALLWISNPALRAPSRFKPEGVTWLQLFLLGGLGMAGFAIPFLVGLAYSNPITVAILAAAAPLIAALVARLCYGERQVSGTALALVLAIAGGILTGVDFSDDQLQLRLEGGEPLVLLAIACWSWYSIAAQRWLAGCSQLHLTTLTTLPATIVLVVIYGVLMILDAVPGIPATARGTDYPLILWVSISTVAIGVLTWNSGVKRIGVVAASMYLNLIPIVAVVSSMALGYQARGEQLAGGLLVLLGVFLAQYRRFAAQRAGQSRAG